MKLFKVILPMLLCLLLLTACAPAEAVIYTSSAVQIPAALSLALNAAILYGVTFGLQWLFEKAKIDLRGIGATVAVALGEFAILQFQGLIDVVPVEYDLYVSIGLNVLLAVLTTLGYIQVAFRSDRAAAMFNTNAPRLFTRK